MFNISLIKNNDIFLYDDGDENVSSNLDSLSFSLSANTSNNVIIDSICEVDLYKDFKVFPITGNIFSYGVTGTTLNGGFYQGFYKLEGYDHQNLPDRFENGVSFLFELKKNDIGSNNDKFKLNEYNEENKGFFFYYGLKSTDPYCGRQITGLICDEKINGDTITIDIDNPLLKESPFLYYTKTNMCQNTGITVIHQFQECDDGVANNSFGIRLTDEGRFNIRYFTNSGNCIDNNLVSELTLINEYSDIIINDDKWHQIILNFNYNEDIKCFGEGVLYFMKLEIYVDGFLTYITNVPELNALPLNTTKERQLTIPYNISLGGGTLGNLENNYFLNDDVDDEFCNYEFCYNESIGDLYFLVVDDQIINNINNLSTINFLTSIFNENIDIQEINRGNCIFFKINIKSNTTINLISFSLHEIEPKRTNCFLIENNQGSNILGENFGGSFEGEMCEAQIYLKSLLYQDINSLYNSFLTKKGLTTNICC